MGIILCVFCCCLFCFMLFLILIAENLGTRFVFLLVFCKHRFSARVKQICGVISSTLSGDLLSNTQRYSLKWLSLSHSVSDTTLLSFTSDFLLPTEQSSRSSVSRLMGRLTSKNWWLRSGKERWGKHKGMLRNHRMTTNPHHNMDSKKAKTIKNTAAFPIVIGMK